jgi:glutamyl-tRNA reductase
MSLVLLGINHTTASIALREKVAFPPEKLSSALQEICGLEVVNEAVIVSTCNRTEIYLDCSGIEGLNNDEISADDLHENRRLADYQQSVSKWLAGFHNLSQSELEASCYVAGADDVVRHLMRVSCGLDSMVLGEPQILGQIKSAFAVSKDLNAVGPGLGRAFQDAFSIAKEVRTDTAIGENPVSVAYAAVALAERIFSHIDTLSVLLIGAGRTIELVARHLSERGVTKITVANRTLDNALELAAKFSAKGVLLSEIPEQLIHTDVVVSSTNSQLPLLGKGAVERALKQRRHKPMLLIDLAVPRDIEAEVGDIPDAYLYSVDDISAVIEDGVKSRTEAAEQAKSIIERGVEDYRKHVNSLNAVATLRAFRSKADEIRESELQRALKALEKGEAPADIISALARGLTNKLIHSPSVAMKKASAEGRDEILILTQELFELGKDGKDNSG